MTCSYHRGIVLATALGTGSQQKCGQEPSTVTEARDTGGLDGGEQCGW